MEKMVAEQPWRWRDAGLTVLVWFVPATGLVGGTVSIERVLSSAFIGLLVGMVLSVPIPAKQAAVAKTSTARRVVEAVWTAAIGAAVLALLGLDDRSLASVLVALTMLWLALAVSTALRPLVIAGGPTTQTGPTWLPISRRSRLAEQGKRTVDIALAGGTLLVAAPFLLLVALAIKIEDGGPVLFRQQRIGRHGIPFEMIKFRSMVLNAEELKSQLEHQSERNGPLFKMTNDPRITRVGRLIRELSIDELPQLLNIVRGDMSVVGPRPALPDEAAHFDSTLQRRNTVTPGLTGLWQAEARSDADFERFRSLDLRYVSTASPSMDLWIIAATGTEVIVAVVRATLRAFGHDTTRTDGIASDQPTIDLRDTPVEPTPPSSVVA